MRGGGGRKGLEGGTGGREGGMEGREGWEEGMGGGRDWREGASGGGRSGGKDWREGGREGASMVCDLFSLSPVFCPPFPARSSPGPAAAWSHRHDPLGRLSTGTLRCRQP